MSGLVDTSQDVTTDTVLEHEHEHPHAHDHAHDHDEAAAKDPATPADIDDEAGGQPTTA